MKFREKVLVNLEYENNKQKMEVLITERTGLKPLLEMDWIRRFTPPNRRRQFVENSQSKNEKNFHKVSGLFENYPTIEDTEINIQIKPGDGPVKQKPDPCHYIYKMWQWNLKNELKRAPKKVNN